MTPSRRFEETTIGWMENVPHLIIGQYSCDGCKAIFYYLNDTNDHLPPRFCPECGRKNSKAVDN
jgi:rRNA maturation endonuclease Nob1